MKVNITKHPSRDGWYYVEYRPDGYQGKRERIPVEGYDSACRRRDEIQSRYDAPAEPKQTHPRLKDVVREYLGWVELYKSAATAGNKRCRLLMHVIPKLGDLRVRDLSQRALDEYGRGMAKGSYRDDIYHLLALVTWMVRRHYAAPLTWKPEIPSYSAPVKTIPAPEDILRWLDAIPKESYRVLFAMMLYTGLRWNEVTHLRWEDYQGDSFRLSTTKTKKQESIYIPDHLQPWFEGSKKVEGWVFTVTGKAPVRNLQRVYWRATKETGVYMSPHLLRHASATMLYDLTGDLYAVKHHLRQSRITTTEIYTRYSIAKSKQAVSGIVVHMAKHRNDPNGGNNDGNHK